MLALALAFSGALLLQSQPDRPTPAPEQAAQDSPALRSLVRFFETVGACGRHLPPEARTRIQRSVANEADPLDRLASAVMLAAYDRGMSSPRAATITQEQCKAEIEAISAEIKTLTPEREKSADVETD